MHAMHTVPPFSLLHTFFITQRRMEAQTMVDHEACLTEFQDKIGTYAQWMEGASVQIHFRVPHLLTSPN